MNKDKIKSVLDSLSAELDKENIKLFKRVLDAEWCGEIQTRDDFHLKLVFPYQRMLKGFIQSEIAANDDIEFLLIHSSFVENHFQKVIKDIEGTACCADKTSTILDSLCLFFKKGTEIRFDYSQEYTFHLPKVVFKEHNHIVSFYKSLKQLYYGNPSEYLFFMANYIIPARKEWSRQNQ